MAQIIPISEQPEDPGGEVHPDNEQNPSSEITNETPPIARAVVEIPEAVLQEYRTSREQQNRESKRTRLIALAAALSAWTYAGVATLQWCTMQGQLTAMQETSRQTEKSIAATQKSADATHTAAAVTQRQLEVSERPWLAADVTVAKPLQFNQDGGRMDLSIKVRNVGRSIALGIFVDSRIVAKTEGTFAQIQNEVCEPLRNRPWNSSGPLLFPNESFTTPFPASINPEEIKAAALNVSGGIFMKVYVCIDYRFSFAEEHHQTRYAFDLGVPHPNGTATSIFIPEGTPEGVQLLPDDWDSTAD